MGVIIDTLKDALSLLDEDRRRKATEALERVEELYYDGRTTVTNEDAFFMALGIGSTTLCQSGRVTSATLPGRWV